MRTIADFTEVVLCDFEYHHEGLREGPPIPLCACALEWRSGRQYRLWTEELGRREPPWAHGRDVLFVSYNAPAELGCYLRLSWPLPEFILDLNIEYRQLVNGILPKHHRRELLNAMLYCGLSGIEAMEKAEWHKLILTAGPFSPEQQGGILAYCWSDVAALQALLPAMLTRIPQDLDRALFRGRYTLAAAHSMQVGIPIDTVAWDQILRHRESIQQAIAADCPCFDGTVFKHERFAALLGDLNLQNSWPRTETNRLRTDDECLKDYARIPEIETLRQILQAIRQLRKPSFQVFEGRNYYSILPFQAETSRNSTRGCIYQGPSWLRGLIQSPPDRGMADIDFEQEEFYIIAVLSGDVAAQKDYETGDVYTRLGILAGTMPAGATEETHPKERATAKTLMIALLYGMAAPSLASKLGVSLNRAKDVLKTIRSRYRKLQEWSDYQVSTSRQTGRIETTFGWALAVNHGTKSGTLRNYKVQGCGAEIMRLAHSFLYEAGIQVCAPVHDAFLIECSATDLEDVVQEARRQMERASEIVLQGRRIRTKAHKLHPADRLIKKRGKDMWRRVINITNRLESDTSRKIA
jgi:hypothetical protein